jgi:3-dehydroquinate synthase
MVDASIGGKTGVDLPEGKNLAGAFWQPKLVWIDVNFLKTLPSREMKIGMAEVIKYGVIKDKSFFRWLERNIIKIPQFERWPVKDVIKAIHRSVAIKVKVVSGDERETPLGGGREILNFGHTAGHALEAAFGYEKLSHGEAISIGMNFAGRIALRRRKWDMVLHMQLLRVLDAVGLPTKFPKLNERQSRIFWQSLQKDKKHIGGKLRFVLPEQMGQVEVVSGIPVAAVRAAIKETIKFGYPGRPFHGGNS